MFNYILTGLFFLGLGLTFQSHRITTYNRCMDDFIKDEITPDEAIIRLKQLRKVPLDGHSIDDAILFIEYYKRLPTEEQNEILDLLSQTYTHKEQAYPHKER